MSSLEMAMPVRHIHIHPDTYSAPAGSAAQAAILPATVPFKAGQPTGPGCRSSNRGTLGRHVPYTYLRVHVL
jgi:hypothetical protein